MTAVQMFPLDVSISKDFPFNIDHAAFKAEVKLLEKAKEIMYSNFTGEILGSFSYAHIQEYRSVCQALFAKSDIPVELFDHLKMVVSMEGYGPYWSIQPTESMPMISLVVQLMKEHKNLTYLMSSGVLAETCHLESEMKHLKMSGTSAEGLKKWKNRIAVLRRSQEYIEKKNQLDASLMKIRSICKFFNVKEEVKITK